MGLNELFGGWVTRVKICGSLESLGLRDHQRHEKVGDSQKGLKVFLFSKTVGAS